MIRTVPMGLLLLTLLPTTSGCFSPGRITPVRTIFTDTSRGDGSPRVEVPLRVTDASSFVEVKVNDAPPREFLIDTGAQLTVLPRSWVDELDLPRRSFPGAMTGVTRRTWGWLEVAHLERLSIGGVTFEGVDVFVIDDEFLTSPLIGFGLFDETRFTLDFPRRRLVVVPADERHAVDAAALPYELSHDRPEISVKLGNQDLRCVIDSGLDYFVFLPESLAPSLDLHSKPQMVRQVTTVNEKRDIAVARSRENLRFGAHEIVEPIIDFGPGRALLGFGVLQHFALTFDPMTRTVELARDSNEPILVPGVRGFGYTLRWLRKDGRPVAEVTNVYPGGPADRAGLRVGDIVVGTSAYWAGENPTLQTLDLQRDGKKLRLIVPIGVIVE